MFDEKEYIEVFSKLTASHKTRQEVMNMVKNNTQKTGSLGRRIAVLATAVLLLTAMTVTAFAAEDIAGWFCSFFEGREDTELSQQQEAFLAEHEQPLGESITHDGWTIQLLSAIHDDAAGYVVFRITVPEDVDGTSNWLFGNFSASETGSGKDFAFLTASPGVFISGWRTMWEYNEENENVRDFVVQLTVNKEESTVDPFGEEAEYYFNIENIAMDTRGEDGKETSEILAEGLWEFTVSFANPENSGCEEVELLSEPVSTRARIIPADLDERQDDVILYSVKMHHLSVTFYFEDCDGAADFTMGWFKDPASREMNKAMPAVILKDGTEILLLCFSSGDMGSITLEAESPIIFEEVSHIRMSDGTVIPMPGTE